MSPDSEQRAFVPVWIGSGVVTIAVAAFLGATVEPWLYAIALFALIDFAVAWLYATGRIGGDPDPPPADDPSHNPYARED